MEFTRASQVAIGMPFHSSMTTSRSRWIFETMLTSTFQLMIPQRFSIGFKSGDMLGQSITVTPSLFSKAEVILEMCLGSLSCWNTALRPSFWREGIILCCSISQYMLEFMFTSMKCNSQTPATLMQPQTMTFPPPCLTVGMTRLSLYSSPGCRYTCLKPSDSNKLIFISSDHRIWFQQYMCFVDLSSANYLLAFLCIVFRRGFLLGWQSFTPIWCRVRSIVWALTGWLPPLQSLQQCWQESYADLSKKAFGCDAQHVRSASLDHLPEACSEWTLYF